MPIPKISSEIIDSIRNQAIRRLDNHSLYCVDVINEITSENPNLAEAIKDTIGLMCKEFDIRTDTPEGFALMLNIANLATSIYQAIKQQMVCNELESPQGDSNV